jgi:hypothetical protein
MHTERRFNNENKSAGRHLYCQFMRRHFPLCLRNTLDSANLRSHDSFQNSRLIFSAHESYYISNLTAKSLCGGQKANADVNMRNGAAV